MNFETNSALDLASFAETFAEKGRIQVPDIIADDGADRIHASLQTLPWRMAFNDREKNYEIPPEAMDQMDKQKQFQIINDIHMRASTGYQFYYHRFPIVGPYFDDSLDKGPLADVLEFVNSDAFLDLGRTITGFEEIRWVDAHASLYAPGHFLNNHDDAKTEDGRLAAYVLNFTKQWASDWGGYLQFFDEKRNIVEAFRPDFNVLNMFRIPADHSVGIIVPYALELRFAITGWFREDDPPGPIG